MKFNSAMSDGLHIKVADMTRIVLKCATIVTRRSAMKGAARRFLMKANTASAKWEIRLRSHFYVLQRVPISMLIRENTIYIWNGSFVDSDVVRAGYELNVPVTRTKGYADFSLLSIDKPNVVIETVKAAEDGSGDTIVRLYESKHASCTAELTLNMPVRHVYACNMLERELDEIACEEGKVKLNLHGFEIKTLRLKK